MLRYIPKRISVHLASVTVAEFGGWRGRRGVNPAPEMGTQVLMGSPLLVSQPTGVFSRLGDALGTDGDKATESDDDCSVLQYAGVLKKLAKAPRKESTVPGGTVEAKATSSEAKPVTGYRNTTGIRKLQPASKMGGVSLAAVPGEAQDSNVTSTKDKNEPEFRVTIKRTWGCGKVSSTSESPGAQMDSAGTVSVFKRLGRKPD